MATILSNKEELEKKGRGGDKILAHLTPGEIVIPRVFAEDDDFRAVITNFFHENKVDVKEFIVGSGQNKVNPKTGYAEFGLLSKLFREVKRPFVQVYDEVLRVGKKLEREGRRIDRQVGLRPKRISPPPLPPAFSPVPTPQEIDIEAQRRSGSRRRRLRAGLGRRGTIITSGLGVADTSKSVLLGGPQ